MNNASPSANVNLQPRGVTVSKITKNIGGFVNKNNIGTLVVVMILIIVAVYGILYVYKKYNDTSLDTITMLKTPTIVPQSDIKNISTDVQLPSNVNGKEYAYSFWMYVDAEQLDQTSANKFVLGRIESSTNLTSGTPIFYMDRSLNKLHVYVKKMGDSVRGINDLAHMYPESVLTIPYVPLQRWVNVILVVDNNFLQLFMDGELRQVKDLSQYEHTSSQFPSVIASPVGNIMIGSSNGIPSFKGFISKVQVFNYAITIDHAKIIYKAGPLHKSILSAIGIPMIGIQNPFYRIDERATDATCNN